MITLLHTSKKFGKYVVLYFDIAKLQIIMKDFAKDIFRIY